MADGIQIKRNKKLKTKDWRSEYNNPNSTGDSGSTKKSKDWRAQYAAERQAAAPQEEAKKIDKGETTNKFKMYEVDKGESKKLFGIDVGKYMGQFGKVHKMKVTGDTELDQKEFIKQFDKMSDEAKKIYVSQVQAKSADDTTARNTLKVLEQNGKFKGNFMDFIEGSNDKLFGGLARGAVRTGAFVTGHNGENAVNDAMLGGPGQYTETGKIGEKFGSAQKGVVDVASVVIPAAGASKLVQGASVIDKLSKGGKAAQIAAKVLPQAAGSVAGTAVSAGQDIAEGREKDLVRNAAIGTAADLVLPGVGKLLKYADKAAGNAVVDIATKGGTKAASEGVEQIGERGVVGGLNKMFSRGGQKLAYKAGDALATTKTGSKLIDMKDDFMTKWVTDMHPLYKTLKRSDFEGKTSGAYLAAREAIGNSNRALSYAQDFIENDPGMKRVVDGIQSKNPDVVAGRKAFDEYAKVRSEIDLATAGKKQFSEKKLGELNERLAKVGTDSHADEYDGLVEFYKDTNKFRLENGLISKEQYDQFEKEGFDYVRQQRELPQWMLDKPAGKGAGSKASITKSDAIQKRNKYASAELLSPLETAIKTAQMAHVEAYRNKAAKTLYGLLDEAGEAKLLRSTDMVREKQGLLTELKEGKAIVNKMNKAIRVHKNAANELKKEITALNRKGRNELRPVIAKYAKTAANEAEDLGIAGAKAVDAPTTDFKTKVNSQVGKTDPNNWRNAVDGQKFGKDPDTNANILSDKQSTMREIARVSRSDKELSDILDRAEALKKDGYLGDNANLAWDVQNNPGASGATKARASKLYKEITAPQVGKTDPTAALKAEALKYKSADEFIKAQGEPLYHGTNREFDKFDIGMAGQRGDVGIHGHGIYLAKQRGLAKTYADSNVRNTGVHGGGSPTIIEAYVDNAKLYDMSKNELGLTSSGKELTDQLKRAGYDGTSKDMMGGQFTEYAIFDQNKVNTKQQLTDLYNQAHAGAKSAVPTPEQAVGDVSKAQTKEMRAFVKEFDKKAGGKEGIFSVREVTDKLLAMDSVELRKVRRMLETRNGKLEPLMDRIEVLNRDLADLQAQRSGIWNQANSMKTTVDKGGMTSLSFLDDGVENVVKVDPSIASAVHNWDKQQQNVMNNFLRMSNNVFKYGTTGLNAGFALPNFVADQVGSAINSKNIMATHNPSNFIHSLFMTIGRPLNAADQDLLQKYIAGNKGALNINQYTKQATSEKVANKLVRDGASKGSQAYTLIKNPKEGFRTLFRSMEDLIGVTENATRIQNFRGTYKAAQKEGLEGAEKIANQAARENSVDFLEMGTYGRVVNSFIPYFNAAIQGNRIMLRNAAERPVSFAAKTAALIGMPIAASTAWNVSDPDRKAIYDTIPEYVKETNYVVIGPGAKWNEEKGKWDGVFLMKKPPGFKEFAEPVRKFIEYKAQNPDSDVAGFLRDEGGSVAADFGSTFTPIDFSDPNKFLSSVTPQILKPTAEAITNKNFFTGEDIVPDYLKDQEPQDQKYEHYSQLTSHIAGMFNTSPLKVDQWIRQTFGEVGTNAINSVDRLSGAPEEAIGGRSLPESISRRFVGAPGGADTDAFYEAYNPAQSARTRASKTVTELVKEGKIQEAKRRAQEYNDTVNDRFDGFFKQYGDSPNYDPKWNERIEELLIPINDRSFSARRRQK